MWTPIARKGMLANGEIICRSVAGKKILVVGSGSDVFSCGAICPHQGTSMENGLVFDEEITCPEHSWTFSLRTGELTFPGNGPRIPVYPVRIVEGMIEVDVE